MTRSIPIIFSFKGKQYSGTFDAVSGSGGGSGDDWHLTIDGYHRGHLHYSQYYKGWVFTSNSGFFDELSDYFEAYLIGWFS